MRLQLSTEKPRVDEGPADRDHPIAICVRHSGPAREPFAAMCERAFSGGGDVDARSVVAAVSAGDTQAAEISSHGPAKGESRDRCLTRCVSRLRGDRLDGRASRSVPSTMPCGSDAGDASGRHDGRLAIGKLDAFPTVPDT